MAAAAIRTSLRLPARIVAAVLLFSALQTGVLLAVFGSTAQTTSNTFSTLSLVPPTDVDASVGGCVSPLTAAVTVTWTAAQHADGYDVHRRAIAGLFERVGHVNGGTTTAYEDPAVPRGVTYEYMVRTTRGSWTSGDSEAVSVFVPVCAP